MLKRILLIIFIFLSIPVMIVCIFVMFFITSPMCLVIFILKGDSDDTLMDRVLAPILFAANLPYKILGL
jgi:hypothetical protein